MVTLGALQSPPWMCCCPIILLRPSIGSISLAYIQLLAELAEAGIPPIVRGANPLPDANVVSSPVMEDLGEPPVVGGSANTPEAEVVFATCEVSASSPVLGSADGHANVLVLSGPGSPPPQAM